MADGGRRGRQLPATMDAELPVDVGQVGLDGVHRKVELLGDLTVATARPGEPGDSRLLRAQLVRSPGTAAPASPPLSARPARVPLGPASLSDAHRLRQQWASTRGGPAAVQEGTVRSQRLGPRQRHPGLQTERGGEPLLGQGPIA